MVRGCGRSGVDEIWYADEARIEPGEKATPCRPGVPYPRGAKLLLAEDLTAEDLKTSGANALPKLHGALLKNEQDVHLFERLAFLARSGR